MTLTDAPADPGSSPLVTEWGIPGFPGVRRFRLGRWADDSPFHVLRCVDGPAPGPDFLVVRPGDFFPGYSCEIDPATVGRLGLDRPEDALVLVIVTAGPAPGEATVNLLGPLVVNVGAGRVAQVDQSRAGHGARVPLPLVPS